MVHTYTVLCNMCGVEGSCLPGLWCIHTLYCVMCVAWWDSGLHILEFSLTHRERECEVLKSGSLSAEVLGGGGGGG